MNKKILYTILGIFILGVLIGLIQGHVYSSDDENCFYCKSVNDEHQCYGRFLYTTNENGDHVRKEGPSVIGVYHQMTKYPTKWLASEPVYGRYGSEHSPAFSDENRDPSEPAGLVDPRIRGAICFGHQETISGTTEKKDRLTMDKDIKIVYDTFDENTKELNKDALIQMVGWVIYKATGGDTDGSGEQYDGQIGAWLKEYYDCATQGAISDYKPFECPEEGKKYASMAAGEIFETKSSEKTMEQGITYKDGNTFIGPFNLSTSFGELQPAEIITDTKLGVTPYCSIDGKTIINLSDLKNEDGNDEYIGNNFYIVVKGKEIKDVTSIKLKKKMKVISSRLVPAEALGGNHQHVAIFWGEEMEVDKEIILPLSTKVKGDCKLIKVDSGDKTKRLDGVVFVLKNRNFDKYIGYDAEGKLGLVEKYDAEGFVTDANGEIYIEGLIAGSYEIIESHNPHEEYELPQESTKVEILPGTTTEIEIENRLARVDLSGYVWIDEPAGKGSVRNNLFKDDEYDENDELLPEVTVRLVKNDGTVVQETKTNSEGEYMFEDIAPLELEDYYIEFEYDGLLYESIELNTSEANGSKAIEAQKSRDKLAQYFEKVEAGSSRDTSIASGSAGQLNIQYELDQENHRAKLKEVQPKEVAITKASTKEARYSLKELYRQENAEIKNVNLGLCRREQPDLALVKDLAKVVAGEGGDVDVEDFGIRFQTEGEGGYVEGFDESVKFDGDYGASQYFSSVMRDKNAYAIYKIRVMNQATTLTTRVNSIIDCYDSNMLELVEAGTEMDDEGNISGRLQVENGNGRAIIVTQKDSGARIEAQSSYDIYIKFKIINVGQSIGNFAEIESYSTFDRNGKIYAGVDKDSNPANADPDDIATYQDDTDKAPGLSVELFDRPKLTGTVFLDEIEGSGGIGKERKGNGMLDPGEKGIEGVQVILTGSGGTYSAITDANGNYEITGYPSGNYTLKFIWGNSEYTVQNYKATIYKKGSDLDNYINEWNSDWTVPNQVIYPEPYVSPQGPTYRENKPSGRYSMALDNQEMRDQIDEEYREEDYSDIKNFHTKQGIRTTMEASLEIPMAMRKYLWYIQVVPKGRKIYHYNDKFDYSVSNINFGIVERPKQDIELEKKVSKVKIKLANGQTISESTIEDGELAGNGINYGGPDATGRGGLIEMFLDIELMQGATLEIEYDITVKNLSELDYTDLEYYNYGTGGANKITLAPEIADYLSEDCFFDENDSRNKEYGWKEYTRDSYKPRVAPEVYNHSESTYNTKQILVSNYFDGKNRKLAPGESRNIKLYVSKALASNEDTYIENDAEIITIRKPGGRITEVTPGNYVPGLSLHEKDDGKSESVTVIPPFGANLSKVLPIIVVTSAFAIIGVGAIIIKKKVLDK